MDPIRYATVDTHCENLTLLGLGDGWRHDSTCLVVGSGCCVEEGKKGSRSRSSQVVVVVVALRVFIHGYILCVRPPCYKLIQSVIFVHIRNGQTRWAVVVLPWRGSRREEKHGGFQVCNLFLPRHSLLLFFLSLFPLFSIWLECSHHHQAKYPRGSFLPCSFVFNAIYYYHQRARRFKWHRCHLKTLPGGPDSLAHFLLSLSLFPFS